VLSTDVCRTCTAARPTPPLLPYTTLFRSEACRDVGGPQVHDVITDEGPEAAVPHDAVRHQMHLCAPSPAVVRSAPARGTSPAMGMTPRWGGAAKRSLQPSVYFGDSALSAFTEQAEEQLPARTAPVEMLALRHEHRCLLRSGTRRYCTRPRAATRHTASTVPARMAMR